MGNILRATFFRYIRVYDAFGQSEPTVSGKYDCLSVRNNKLQALNGYICSPSLFRVDHNNPIGDLAGLWWDTAPNANTEEQSGPTRVLSANYIIVRRAGLLLSQQDFEWRWSVPLFQCLTVLEFSFILFDLCLLITFFNFIMNYVPIVTFWIFTYHKIWILSIMFCFIWSYWIIYFLACL